MAVNCSIYLDLNDSICEFKSTNKRTIKCIHKRLFFIRLFNEVDSAGFHGFHSDIHIAVCEFNRRRIKAMASLALNQRLLVRLQRLREVTALRRQQNTHQGDAT